MLRAFAVLLVCQLAGEVLGREEAIVGKARIVSVLPKFSTAEMIEGADKVTEGMVVRLPPAPKQ